MHSRRARMRAAEIAVRVAMLGIMALLAACAAPPLALDGADMFGGKRRIDPFDRSLEQRPQAWTLFKRAVERINAALPTEHIGAVQRSEEHTSELHSLR